FSFQICGMSHVSISVNRFFAVYAPLTYTSLFSKRNTRVLICSYWTVAAVGTTYALKIIDCTVSLPHGTWIFTFKYTAICQQVQWYGEFIKYVVYVVIVAMLDFSSVMRLHYMNHRGVHDLASAQRRSCLMNLVYQAALQGIFFTSELITYFILSPYARNKWEAFLLTTVSWCLVHGMDG
ncbi:hypothetical protein PFISCL1PPCAC_13870, partial [Pristionchus fissidentatus]